MVRQEGMADDISPLRGRNWRPCGREIGRILEFGYFVETAVNNPEIGNLYKRGFEMSHAMAFDTLAYAKKLKEAGFTEKQAEVQAEILFEIVDEQLATKQDIMGLERQIKELEMATKRDIKELEMRLTIRLGIMIAASITIVAVLVKLL